MCQLTLCDRRWARTGSRAGDVGAVPERHAGSGVPVAAVRNLGAGVCGQGLPSG